MKCTFRVFRISQQKGKMANFPLTEGFNRRWRKDGKELFYLAYDGTIMGVAITTKVASFEAGTPQGLFQSNLKTTDPRRPEFDVFPDGQQFLVLTSD